MASMAQLGQYHCTASQALVLLSRCPAFTKLMPACRYGRLGSGHEPSVMEPAPVAGMAAHHVVAAACGSAHTLALTAEGAVYAFGYGGHGALGLGSTDNRLLPELVPGLPPCK